MGFAPKVRIALGSGQYKGAVATWSVISMRYFLTILTPWFYQVATARCTDPIQKYLPTFEAKLFRCDYKRTCAFSRDEVRKFSQSHNDYLVLATQGFILPLPSQAEVSGGWSGMFLAG